MKNSKPVSSEAIIAKLNGAKELDEELKKEVWKHVKNQIDYVLPRVIELEIADRLRDGEEEKQVLIELIESFDKDVEELIGIDFIS
jgi:hypothetical protein